MTITAQTCCIVPITLAAGWLAGCTDFATPAELSRPQILAVRADPPVVAAGERSRLTLLIGGPSGRIEPAAVEWLGPVEEIDGEWWYTAPAAIDAGGFVESLEVVVELDDGTTLSALKTIGVGLPVEAANPVIEAVFVDGAPLAEGEALAVGPERTVTLDVRVAPVPATGAIFAWYATTGEIDRYRRSPTELVAPDVPDEGSLFVVYRDGLGGVAWREVTVDVDDALTPAAPMTGAGGS